MRRLYIGLAAALIMLVLLVAQAPARLLPRFVPTDTLSLHGVSGTLWRGDAARASVAVAGGQLQLGSLNWRLSAWSLLFLSPRLEVHSAWGNQHLDGMLTYGGEGDLALSNVDASLPAALVRQFVPLELSGSFSVLAKRIVLRGGVPYAADGRLVWEYAGWISPQGPRRLGQYALDVSQPDGEELVGEVTTLDGDLRAEGRVLLSQRNYDINVLLSGSGLQDPPLQQALQLVASPEGGNYRVQLQGAF